MDRTLNKFTTIAIIAGAICLSTAFSLALSAWIDRTFYERSCDRWVAEGLLKTAEYPEEPIGMKICRKQRLRSGA